MPEVEIAVAVLAAVALPLVGIGPMLLRVLHPLAFAVAMVVAAGVVLLLTGAPWAAAFMLCIGGALLWRHRPLAPRRAVDERSLPVGGFTRPSPDRES